MGRGSAGEGMSGEDDAVDHALVAELAALTEGAVFKVAEFGIDGVVVWEVRRDSNGTPQARQRPPLPASPATDPAIFYEQHLGPLIGTRSRLLIVCSAADERPNDMFEMLSRVRPDARVYSCGVPLAARLRDVIRDSPLTRWYELVVLRQTRSGRLRMDGHPLFPPGAQRGYSQQFKIRCEPGDPRGTVFAVVTREARRFQIVSLQSGDIAPGSYNPTAVLARPGHVVLEGLPVALQAEQRPWAEIVAAVPARLGRPPSVHLVCMVEVSCTSRQLAHRIDRLEQLIACAGGAGGQLSVSLISYGPHAFDYEEHEEPAAVLAWATSGDRALTVLRGLRGRTPPEDEYPRAAQLECALAEVVGRLTGRDGRPVLVTVGSRPPHPARVDIQTEILPCPGRRSWRGSLEELCALPDIRFGALCDQGAGGEIWKRLGREAREPLSVVEVSRFAADIGLFGPLQYVPFPLIDQEGT
jgi:hypothetical protein